jgi:hypothetical protein
MSHAPGTVPWAARCVCWPLPRPRSIRQHPGRCYRPDGAVPCFASSGTPTHDPLVAVGGVNLIRVAARWSRKPGFARGPAGTTEPVVGLLGGWEGGFGHGRISFGQPPGAALSVDRSQCDPPRVPNKGRPRNWERYIVRGTPWPPVGERRHGAARWPLVVLAGMLDLARRMTTGFYRIGSRTTAIPRNSVRR